MKFVTYIYNGNSDVGVLTEDEKNIIPASELGLEGHSMNDVICELDGALPATPTKARTIALADVTLDAPIPEPNATDKASDSEATDQPTEPKFEPYKGKIRKPGTGCVTMINDHLYEGRYTPTNAYGKRESHNIYAKTREECEEKLAEMIKQKNAEITAEKERLKSGKTI